MNLDTSKQIIAMIRRELAMTWRRGSGRVLLIAIGIMPIVGYFAFTSVAMDQQDSLNQLTAEALMWYRTTLVISDTFLLLPVVIFLVPLMVSDAIPLDRQYHVRELMAALPLPPGGYLAGKMLAVWVGMTAVALVSALLDVALSLAYRGAFVSGPVIGMWVLGIWPIMLLGSQMGVMLAAGQKSRRGAVLVSALAVLINIAAMFVLPTNDIFWAAVIQGAFIPNSPTIGVERYPPYPDFASPLMLGRIALVIAVMAAVWFVTARNMERDEAYN